MYFLLKYNYGGHRITRVACGQHALDCCVIIFIRSQAKANNVDLRLDFVVD